MAAPNQTPLRPIPVYVMLPLDILDGNNKVQYGQIPDDEGTDPPSQENANAKREKALQDDLVKLESAGVEGVMVDCWWGRVEAKGPGQYNWTGYEKLFSIVRAAGLNLHVVMSFHACTDLITRAESIPLPDWVKTIGMKNDLFYRDAHDDPSTEYLSLAVDKKLVLEDQFGNQVSPLQVYYKFMQNFRRSMDVYFSKTGQENIQRGFITKIEVGLGPCGELRYPAYRGESWTVAGIGAFQCYDTYMMEEWKKAAKSQNLQLPQGVGPQTAGEYNSTPEQTLFFQDQPEQPETSLIYGPRYWDDYGKSFLTWYSSNLVAHGKEVLLKAKEVFQSRNVKIAAKVPGIHWYFNSKHHAAEATAGLFEGDPEDNLSVYKSIADMLESLKATFIFTCAEMKDDSNNGTDKPHKLVMQVLEEAQPEDASKACENASEAYDNASYNRIFAVATTCKISYFTYMRLCAKLMEGDDGNNWKNFKDFVNKMKYPNNDSQNASTSQPPQ